MVSFQACFFSVFGHAPVFLLCNNEFFSNVKCETIKRQLVVEWICERFRSVSKLIEINFTTSAFNFFSFFTHF